MQLFNFLNGLAGRSDFADAALRFFYVAAVPLLAMLLAALLVFRPHAARLESQRGAASRWKVALATALAVACCLLLTGAVNAFAWRFFGTEILSPRPFVIHRATLLVVEPNDNSFPSPETMIAGALAVALWAIFPPLALPAFLTVTLLCLVRIVCGTNYPADVFAGTLAGAALCTLMLALCRVSLQLPRTNGRNPVWRARPQALGASLALLSLVVFSLLSLSTSPRYGDALRALLQSPTNFATSPARARLASIGASTRNARRDDHAHDASAHEGEGAPATAAEAAGAFVTRDLPPAGQTLLGGYLPESERFLLAQLQREKLPHRLVSIDVAQVRAGTEPYRAAAVRFEVAKSGAIERRAALATAVRIVRAAFAADARLQNIDVAGVVLNDPRRGTETLPVFAVGAIPVFTASVARGNLVVRGKAWVNAPGVDDGLWLRARTQLYINANVLPPADAPLPLPLPTRTLTATPTPTDSPTPTASPLPTHASTPTLSPPPRATASPSVPLVAPTPRIFATPTRVATPPPAASTRVAPTGNAQAQAAVKAAAAQAAKQRALRGAAARQRAKEVAAQKQRALAAQSAAIQRAAQIKAAAAQAAARQEEARREASRRQAGQRAAQKSRVQREQQARPPAKRRRTYRRRLYRRRNSASTRRSYRRGTRWRTRRSYRRYRSYR